MADKDKPGSVGNLPPAEQVIKAFGGLRPMATKLGVAVSTVQGWSTRNHIPENRHALIVKAAEDYGIDLTPQKAEAGPAAPAGASSPEAAKEPDRIATPSAGAISSPQDKKPEDKKPEEKKAEEKKSEAKKADGKTGSVPASGSGASAKPTAAPSPPPSSPSSSGSAKSASAKPAASSSSPASTSPSSSSAARSAAPAQQKSGGLVPGVILGAVLVGIGFAIAIVSAPYWQPLVGGESDNQSEALAALEQRLSALESQPTSSVSEDDLAALKAQIAGLSDELRAGGDVSALEQRVSDLESEAPEVSPAELDSLNGKVAAVVGQLDSMANRISELEDRPVPQPGAAPGDVALILAANELEEEVLAGLDYSEELSLVRDLSGGDASVSALLTPLGAAGGMIETRQGLAQDFAQILPDIVAAGYGEDQDDSLISGVLERLSRVVSVRPVGDVEGDGPDAIAARAEARLANADLPGAVKQLEKLQGKAAEIAAPWLASANARLAAEQSLNELIALLLRRQAGESQE